ncbi:hypothetical protein ACH5RR_030170 [Cinchona calisaya]|uniref:Uncharacterized protein n=1 Tax=Cinchona calisaya TaxID=153742 RepID=A0ABD2YV85_9GENT
MVSTVEPIIATGKNFSIGQVDEQLAATFNAQSSSPHLSQEISTMAATVKSCISTNTDPSGVDENATIAPPKCAAWNVQGNDFATVVHLRGRGLPAAQAKQDKAMVMGGMFVAAPSFQDHNRQQPMDDN